MTDNLTKQRSNEYDHVIQYMEEVLTIEFSTDVLTLEYLILSILDSRQSHACMILDNYLMSSSMEELKNIYGSILSKYSETPRKFNELIYDIGLQELMSKAEIEAINFNSPKVGTEHVLLAILNKENNYKTREVFEKFNLSYDFLKEKCNNTFNDQTQELVQNEIKPIRKSKKKKVEPQIPYKSQVSFKESSMVNDKNDFINKYSINLSSLAKQGKIDKIVGRDKEIKEIIKILARRKKNNAVLIGNGGCGKTAIVYGLADLIEKEEVPSNLIDKEIIMLDMMELIGGTTLRGMFEERVKKFFNELKSSDRYILFIDDIHNIMKNGSKERDTDISGMIGDVLEDGTVKIIATTNFKDYKNTMESNSSLSRKFQTVQIESPTVEECVDILNQSKLYYEEYHKVRYTSEAIQTAVELAERYVTGRTLPDSAFDIIDLAGANTTFIERDPIEIQNTKNRLRAIDQELVNAMNNGDFEVVDSLNTEKNVLKSDLLDYSQNAEATHIEPIEISPTEIREIVSEMTQIPIQKLSTSEKAKLLKIDTILKSSIIGQDEAISSVCKVIKRNKVGLGDANKPIATILLLGQSGCGKTLLAKKLAEEVFGDPKALIRIDMSEYSEKNSVAKLTGAAPGYIGYENGGQLTEAVKHKQHCVLLLDEIEKADQEVYNLFLQLFDEGRLTDSSGQIVNFKNVIILMTSNVGARKAQELGGGMGFLDNGEDNKKSIVEKELKKRFTPEFINRIDKIVHFNPLSDENLMSIVRLEINKLAKRLENLSYKLEYTDDVTKAIHKEAIKDKALGARPIIRLIQDNIEDKITDLMLERAYEKNYVFQATCKDGEIIVS